MNKKVFIGNFISALHVIVDEDIDVDINDFLFSIHPVEERNKKYNSRDDYLRRWLFNDKNLEGRVFSFNEVVLFLTGMEPYFPLWIKIRPQLLPQQKNIITLEVSLRFRGPRVILSQGMIYPPFITQIKY